MLTIISCYKTIERLCLAFISSHHFIMRSFCSCFVLAAVFQVIFCFETKVPRELKDLGIYHPYQQKIPRHCWQPPHDVDLHKCCPIPHLYSDEIMDICEIEKSSGNDSDTSIRPKKRIKVPCQDGKCLMKNANLLTNNGDVDYEKLKTYIDGWAAANPEFTEAILLAKPLCTKPKGEDWYRGQPPDICDQDRVFMCFDSEILWNCKLKVEEFEECQRLKEHMEECKPYYEKPKAKEESTTAKDQ
ncbi:hypothetical protein PYW08_003379 [Mythimna loreyi]|uniref:Uncharacterized protein n=1 Tax=Mythimna loreyi TaxID=667449 RepID=A0ACC2QTK8_9NEOP|nr:hypothetical protein PYW08_003379 [Mythimna loreyi]